MSEIAFDEGDKIRIIRFRRICTYPLAELVVRIPASALVKFLELAGFRYCEPVAVVVIIVCIVAGCRVAGREGRRVGDRRGSVCLMAVVSRVECLWLGAVGDHEPAEHRRDQPRIGYRFNGFGGGILWTGIGGCEFVRLGCG